MALGAKKKGDVLKLILAQELELVGLVIGNVRALGATRFLPSLLYGIKPADPLTFASVSVILTAMALLVSYIPARQATKLDPMVALRCE